MVAFKGRHRSHANYKWLAQFSSAQAQRSHKIKDGTDETNQRERDRQTGDGDVCCVQCEMDMPDWPRSMNGFLEGKN